MKTAETRLIVLRQPRDPNMAKLAVTDAARRQAMHHQSNAHAGSVSDRNSSAQPDAYLNSYSYRDTNCEPNTYPVWTFWMRSKPNSYINPYFYADPNAVT